MADWSDIEFVAGQTNYIAFLNTLRQRAEATLTEIENARGGFGNIGAHIAQQMTSAETSALIAATAVLASGLTQNFNAAGFRITGAADPNDPQDVATRSWVLANLTVGGSPGSVAITSFNIGTLGADQVVTRSGTAIVGRTITPGSARVTVAVSAGAITIDVPANAFPSTANANTWTQPQTLSSTEPTLELNETDAAVNARRWRMRGAGGELQLQALSDDGSIANTIFAVARNGSTLTSTTFATRLNDNLGDVRAVNVRLSNANTNIVTDDRGGTVRKNDANAYTYTVRTDANGGYAAFGNMSVVVANDGPLGSGNLTIARESGVTLTEGTTEGPFVLTPGQSRFMQRVGANEWRLR